MKDIREVLKEAHEKGIEAGNKINPTPMTVMGNGKEYFVADGVCGFAQICIKGNTKFGRWLKKYGLARNSYPSGLSIGTPNFNQSLQRKEAYADAYAGVLRENGIEAYSQSRMD